jgi:hypothetical protein
MPMVDVTAAVEQATRLGRLAEQVLGDRLVQQATAALQGKGFGPKGRPGTAVQWVRDHPGALIGNELYRGREGQVALVDAGAAKVLSDARYAVIREPLQVHPSDRRKVAAELREAAAQLRAAAAELDLQGGAEAGGSG